MDGEEEFDDRSDEEDWMDTAWSESIELPDQSKGNPGTSHNVTQHADAMNMVKKAEKMNDIRAGMEGDNLMCRMRLNDNKAGMEGLDKEKINQIILEASKGSKFYENERKKEEQIKKRILEQQDKLDKITESQLNQGLIQADMLLEEFERARDLSRTIVHIDMDAFYAAVEIRDKPSLRDKPMAVGGNSMLSTSNYCARKYGVRAAMPGFIGKKLCPDLVIVPANFEKYTTVSKQVKEIMADYDPNFCPMSLDEAYLDITDHLQKRNMMTDPERTYLCRKCDNLDIKSCLCDLNETMREKILFSNSTNSINFLTQKSDLAKSELNVTAKKENCSDDMEQTSSFKCSNNADICPVCGKPFPEYDSVVFGTSPDDTVQEMRSRIEQKTRLTASAGIAPNMMLAKVCSDKNKPNGQYRILPTVEAVMEFIKDLPIRKISGIGKVSEQMLNAVGVVTCTDLYNQKALLYHLYSPISFNYFMRICLGIGSTTVERDSERKSISTERTFSEISKPSDLYNKCYELCESLSEDLVDEKLKGKTVAIKLKTVNFEVKTRAHTLPEFTSDVDVIFASAKDLLKTEMQNVAPNPLRLRLMGVRMSSLLHQSLCKSKQKQNTITGLIKKLGNKSTQNKNVATLSDKSQPILIDNENTSFITPSTCKIQEEIEKDNLKEVQNFYECDKDVPVLENTDFRFVNDVLPGKMGNCVQNKMNETETICEDFLNTRKNNEIICERDQFQSESKTTESKNDNKQTDSSLIMSKMGFYAQKTCDISDIKSCDTTLQGDKDLNENEIESSESYLQKGQKDSCESRSCEDEQLLVLVGADIHAQENKQHSANEKDNEVNSKDIKYDSVLNSVDDEKRLESNLKTDEILCESSENEYRQCRDTEKSQVQDEGAVSENEYRQGRDSEKSQVQDEGAVSANEYRQGRDTEKSQVQDEGAVSANEYRQGRDSEKSQVQNEGAVSENEIQKRCVYVCPICQNDIRCENLSTFNQHIDICLNKKVVMDCSRNENLRADLEQSKQPGKSPQRKISKSSPMSTKSTKKKSSTLRPPNTLGSKSRTLNVLPSSPTVEKVRTEPNESTDKNLSPQTVKLDKIVEPDTPGIVNCETLNSGQKEERMTISDTKLVCPVCFMEQSRKSLDEFNSHVDSCLSKGTISDILKEQHNVGKEGLKRSALDIADKSQSGKRKRSNSGQVSKTGQNKIRSIDSFFKM